ncbi:unnamed protein product, partial [Sphagnum balticum]
MSVADALSCSSGSSSKEEPGDEQQEPTGGGDKFSVSRQLSMRKSRTLSEHEKDNNLSGPLGVPRLPVTTALSPLTPLKWKSIQRDDVGKEAQKGNKSVASQPEEVIEEQQPPMVLTDGDQSVDLQAKGSVGTIPANGEQAIEQSSGGDASGLERKVSAGDETSVTTVDFLRARLLAERAASKAAKEHVQQITKKVVELERKLEQETLLRKKAEAAEQEALLKLKMKREEVLMTRSSTEVSDTTETLNVGEEAQRGAEDQKDLVEPSVVEEQGTDAAGTSNQIHWESLLQPGDVDEKTEKAMSNSKSVQDFSTSDESDVTSTPGTGLKTSQPETNWQETRSGREERLRNMWHQITEELAVLAEYQSQEELPNWMGQLPAILQDIIPETFKNSNLQNSGSGKSEASMDGPISEVDTEQDRSIARNQDGESSEGTEDRSLLLSSAEVLQPKDAGPQKLDADDSRMQTKDLQLKTDSEAKKVAELIERYEAQESLQREWEQNYYAQQKLDRLKVGKCKSRKEGHSSHTSSEAGTPPSGPQLNSQHGALTETTIDTPDAAPLHDLLMSHEADSEKVDSHPHVDALYMHSDSPSMILERVDIPVSANVQLEAKDGEEDTWLGPQESGLEKSINPTHGSSGTRFARSKGHGRQLEKEPSDLNYPQATSHERRFHEDVVSYSGRELLDVEEVHNPQGVSQVRLSKDVHRSSFSDFRGMSSIRDASGEELGQGQLPVQKDRGEPVSPSVSSNGGHSRADLSSGYPLRDSERGREKNRRRREGISRSGIREGAHGSKPRPQADNNGWKGDKDLHYREKQDFSEMGFQYRQDTENSRQAEDNGGMPDNTIHAKAAPPLSLSYPSQDTPKKDTNKPQASLGQASSNVSDVLRALQIAKLNIQGLGVKKVTSPFLTANEY